MIGNESVYSAVDDTIAITEKVRSRKLTKKDLQEDNKKCNVLLCVVSIVTIALTLGTMYFLFGRTFITRAIVTLRSIAHNQTPLNLFILFSVQFLFGFVLFMPGLATYNILQAFLMKSFWLSFLISAGGCYACSLTVYLVVRSCCHRKIYNKLKHMVVYRMLLTESRKTPIKTGIMFNFLFIPVSVKNYLFAISGLKFHHCLLALPPGHCLMTALLTMIGAKANDISEVFTTKDYANKSRLEKLQFFVSMALLLFTLVFFFTLFCIIKRKYKEYQEKQLGILEDFEDQEEGQKVVQPGAPQLLPAVSEEGTHVAHRSSSCGTAIGFHSTRCDTNPFTSSLIPPTQEQIV